MQRYLLALGIIGLTLVHPAGASAGTFGVDPVTAKIDGSHASAIVTVTNRSTETARLQVTAFTWHQSSAGAMQLLPSDDVLTFPSLFVLAPGEYRRIRIAVSGPPAPIERAYRVFVQELPPSEPLRAGGTPAGIAMRTRVGIPVFVAIAAARANVHIGEWSLHAGTFESAVVNDGTAHAIVRTLRGQFYDAAGRLLNDRTVEGWYVLANEHRTFRFVLPLSARPARVQLDANVDGTIVSKTVELDGRGS